MSKLTVVCEDFRPFARNTLVGFAQVRIKDMALVVKDIALHQKNAARWAALPAKPMLKDGAIVKDTEGKGQYVSVMEFTSREARDAFSAAVIAAVLAHSPNAFGEPVEVDGDTPF
jgi:hypothetical protein